MTEQNISICLQPIPKNPKFKNLTGRKFSRWTVLGFAGIDANRSFWFCRCDCSEIRRIDGASLTRGNSKSCGCLMREVARINGTTHGQSVASFITPEYRAYRNAKSRCETPGNSRYAIYGGRGIKFLFKNFEEFFEAVGKRPSPDHSIERIDTNGNYQKENIKWATSKEQSRNRRNNKLLNIGGVAKTIVEWSEETGTSAYLIYQRYKKGWCHSCCIKQFDGYGKCEHCSVIQ